MMTLGDSLKMNSLKFPEKICLVDDKRRFSFRQFNKRVNRLANGLKGMGLKRGDKLGVFSRNSIEYMEIYHACAKAGICAVTFNFWLRPDELAVLFNHSDAVVLFLGGQYQDSFQAIEGRLVNLRPNGVVVIGETKNPRWTSYEKFLESQSEEEPKVEVSWEDPYWMLYTSGTTGNPKGVIRSHKRTALCSWFTLLEFGYWRNDYFLAVSPFFHGVTFFPLMILQVGGGVYIAGEFEPETILKVMKTERITATFMVPTMLDLLLNCPSLNENRPDALRSLVTGGAPLPTQLKENVINKFGSVLYEFYGAGESGYLTVLHPKDQLRKTRCCGQPCFGTEMEVRDKEGRALPPGEVGELFSKCSGRFDGYYKYPEKTAEALHGEWFTAGDLGMKDEEDYYYIVDRKTDMIISGGENIYPREIEDVLRFHPAVAECAVFGVPDDRWGEAVKALIVLKPGQKATEEEITLHCQKHLAGFKRPKIVNFVGELPKTSSGKIMKKSIRDAHWTGKEKV
jgi:acyl-CoA synthetase (AMP-forming)/AMP-acid ligase II